MFPWSNSDVHIQGTIISLGLLANNLDFRNRWQAYGQEIRKGTRLLEESDFSLEYVEGNHFTKSSYGPKAHSEPLNSQKEIRLSHGLGGGGSGDDGMKIEQAMRSSLRHRQKR
jgi:hypothetical protein